MWIVTNKGFFSVVAKDAAGKPSGKSPDSIVSVRFRRPADGKALFPHHKLVMTPVGDYACRVFATREEVAHLMVEQVLGMDYVNFKNSIPKTPAGNKLHDAAMQAWTVFGKLQDGGPYGKGATTATSQLDFDGAFDAAKSSYGNWAGAVAKIPPRSGSDRNDPFCDGCGERIGVKHLNKFGLCKVCRTIPEMVRVWGGKMPAGAEPPK